MVIRIMLLMLLAAGSVACSQPDLVIYTTEENLEQAQEIQSWVLYDYDVDSEIAIVDEAPAHYEHEYGTMTLSIVPSADPNYSDAMGHTKVRGMCDRSAWVMAGTDPNAALHEVGHMLSLHHHSDPMNVMYKISLPAPEQYSITADQQFRAEVSMRLLRACK